MSVTILQGDTRERLAELPPNSFDCCVTSPPYWGLRDYGHAGQIGLEPTLSEYLGEMVGAFRQVRRILRPSGTLWLNVGDSYARGADVNLRLKAKDLCMVPNRLALALQYDGWFVRSEIIWHKPNPMPESVTDRPTNSHEKVWLLTKSERYFYDAAAIREPDSGRPSGNGFVRDERVTYAGRGNPEQWEPGGGRNARNVWSISPEPFPGAHFATMPPGLAERCIKAGSPLGGAVLDPFGGAGTTALVADRLGRHATLIELNPEYIDIARRRIEGDAPLFAEVLA